MNVAITGTNGFLGKHLLESLKNDFEIVPFDRTKHDLFSVISLESFLKEAEVVVHLAGANRDTDYNLLRINVLGTTNLLEAIKKYSPMAKIIFASSFQVYDDTIYGLSKKLAEDAILFFSRIYDIKSIILRISNIYGHGGRPFYNSVIATFIHLIKNNKPIVINGTGEQRRDYVYVDDVVAAIKKAISYENVGTETFDICSEEMTSINKLIGYFKKICKKEIKVEYNKEESTVRQETKGSYLNAQNKLSWKPVFSIEEGLKEMMSKI